MAIATVSLGDTISLCKGIIFLKYYFSNVNLFMFSYFKPNCIEKFLWEVAFQILAKIEMTQNKNRLFGCHFETVQHLFFPGIVGF